MKIAVLLYQNMRYAPFVKLYEQILHAVDEVTYDVIYLNRNPELQELCDDHHIAISWFGKNNQSSVNKAITSVLYSFRVKKILNCKSYDFIIVLTTMPGVLLANYLIKHFHKRYLMDIRDYTREYIKPYFFIEKKIVNGSAINVISSPDFVKFLPSAEYHVCHNLTIPGTVVEGTRLKKAPGKRIVIAYVGIIQYVEQCLQLIKLVNADDRFELRFYGPEDGNNEISTYIAQLNNPRISMKGRYLPKDKGKIITQSDILFNCYGNGNNIVKYAISNKYYDGACYRSPLLVSPSTTMARLTGEFGFPLDFKNVSDLEELYRWYCKINAQAFEQYCTHL